MDGWTDIQSVALVHWQCNKKTIGLKDKDNYSSSRFDIFSAVE